MPANHPEQTPELLQPFLLAGARLGGQPSAQRRTLLRGALGLAGAGLLGLAGCGGAADDSTGTVYLRVLNATLDYPSADFRVNGSKVFAAVANGGETTGYELINSGDNQLSLHTAGSTTAKLSETRNYAQDTSNSVVAYGSLATGIAFKYLEEINAKPDSGSIKLRVLHAAAGLSALDVFFTSCTSSSCPATSLSGLTPSLRVNAAGTFSDAFLTLANQGWRIRITPKDTPSTLLFDYYNSSKVSDFPNRAVVTLVLVDGTGSYPQIMALPEQLTAVGLPNSLIP